MNKSYFIHYILLVLCMGLSQFGKGQDGVKQWEKMYETNNDGTFEDIIVDSKGDIVTVGEWAPDSDRRIIIQKFKPNGTLVWQKVYREQGADIQAYYIKESAQNTYTLLGTINDRLAVYVFNENGAILSFKWKNQNINVSDFRVDTDGSYIFCGGKEDKPFIGKYNTDLNPIWEKFIDYKFPFGVKPGSFYSFSRTPDGGYYLLSAGTGLKAQNSMADAVVTKLDRSGNLIWAKVYGGNGHEGLNDSDNDGSRSEIISTMDGGFAFAIHTRSKDLDIKETDTQSGPWVVKADDKGTIQWAKKLGADVPGGGGFPCGIREKGNGGLVVFGRGGTFRACTSDKEQVAWVVEFSKNEGRLLAQNCFGGGNYDCIRSIVLSKNVAYAAGFNNDDAWVFSFKIDNNLLSTASDEVSVKYTGLKIVQNPVQDFLILEFKNVTYERLSVEVFDLCGRKIWEKNYEKGIHHEERIAMSSFPTGHYILRAVSGKGGVSMPFIKL